MVKPLDVAVAALRDAGYAADPDSGPGWSGWAGSWSTDPRVHYRAEQIGRQSKNLPEESFEEWCAFQRAHSDPHQGHRNLWLDHWGSP